MTIPYDVTGHGPVVIAIQKVGVIGNGWRPQVDALARHFRVVTFDKRDIGGSAPVHRARCADPG